VSVNAAALSPQHPQAPSRPYSVPIQKYSEHPYPCLAFVHSQHSNRGVFSINGTDEKSLQYYPLTSSVGAFEASVRVVVVASSVAFDSSQTLYISAFYVSELINALSLSRQHSQNLISYLHVKYYFPGHCDYTQVLHSETS